MPFTKKEMIRMPTGALLDVAVEEAAELILAIQKLKTYGPFAIAPDGTQYDNAVAVIHEARQVSDAMRVWCRRCGGDWDAMGLDLEREAQNQIADGIRPERAAKEDAPEAPEGPSELHNRLAGQIVASIIKPVLDRRGDTAEILVLLESVVAGVLLGTVKLGGDEIVFDELIGNVKNRLADMRLSNIKPSGQG